MPSTSRLSHSLRIGIVLQSCAALDRFLPTWITGRLALADRAVEVGSADGQEVVDVCIEELDACLDIPRDIAAIDHDAGYLPRTPP